MEGTMQQLAYGFFYGVIFVCAVVCLIVVPPYRVKRDMPPRGQR